MRKYLSKEFYGQGWFVSQEIMDTAYTQCQWRIQDFTEVGGANPPGWGGGANIQFCHFFQKLHEIKRIWTPSLAPSLDPPLPCEWALSTKRTL